jgi:hypothetical protein
MINKIKETLNQIFFSPEASGTWEKNTEQTIDELEAPPFECGPGHLTQGYGFFGYTGIPAPAYLKDDEWFGPAPVSEKGQDYMEKETEIKQQEEENRQYWTKESANIHQEMYDLATKSGKTTTQLDPIGGSENFQGGSENVHR